MAEIVNLRQARKRRARADAEKQAADNRALYGVSAKDRRMAASRRDIDVKRLDDHRRENGGDAE